MMKWTEHETADLCKRWEYFNSNKNEAELTFNRNWDNIRKKAKKCGCKFNKQLKSNSYILNSDYINGLMLSDGSIGRNNIHTGYYVQSCIYKEWLETIKNAFGFYGINSTISNGRINNKGSFYYILTTNSYIEFADYFRMWYHNGKKIVPDNIKMTPACVANWYLGDGSISSPSKNSYSIKLATCGFDNKYVNMLSHDLNNAVDINSHMIGENRIQISKTIDTIKFLDYIEEFYEMCYDYKFPDVSTHRKIYGNRSMQ